MERGNIMETSRKRQDLKPFDREATDKGKDYRGVAGVGRSS
jgi:hypothetical protein